MTAKKKTRKQLLKEPDEFITLTGKAITFVTGYQKQISYLLCTIMAIALKAFQSIINKYGGNAAGKLARVMYANISYDAQQYEKAIALYKQSLNDFKDDKLVYNMVLSNLGHAYQRIEDEQNAAAYFEKAASATDSPIREDAQEILKNHPDSIYFDLVEEELNALNK
jgi:tetratricopeptide (TPR) repeat protein